MATIGDVAREAGVSRSTVSAVVNGRKLVMPDTRARVEAAIAKLDYTVNSGARALATSRTMTLGLVVRFHDVGFSPALATYIVAVTDAARDHGYRVLLLTDFDGAEAIRTVVRTRQVDGLVLLSVIEDDPRLTPLLESGFPAVLVGMPSGEPEVDAVDLDFAAGARVLVDTLADAGHRAATFITWPDEIYASGSTYAAHFRDACTDEAARREVELTTAACPVGPEEVRETLRSIFESRNPPHAVIVHNDGAVAMLPIVLKELGVRVPEDCSVVSLHSAELSRQFAIPYTAVESQPERVSSEAVDVLVERLGDPGRRPTTLLVPPLLTQRNSVAAP